MKKRNRLENSDKWIVAGTSICALFLLSWLIYEIAFHNPMLEGQNEIGQIYQVTNRVKRKFSKSLLWYPASQNEAVYENDWIFTGSDSVAKIRLKSGGEIVIEPDSLIVLSRKNGVLQLDLQHGQLLANVKEKDIKINVVTNGKKQSIDTSKGSVRIAKKVTKEVQPEVNFLDTEKTDHVKEDVTLSKVTDKKKYKPKEGFTQIQENGLSVKQVTTKKVKLYKGQKTHLNLEWKDPENQWTLYWIEVSDDPDFERILTQGEASASPFEFSHGESGNFFWRIKGLSDVGIPSKWSNNAIINLDIKFLEKSEPLQLARDSMLYQMKRKDLKKILPDRSINTEDKPVKIAWKKFKNADKYKVQVSDKEDFSNIRVEELITENELDLTNLNLGKTFFRVVPESDEGIALAEPATGQVTTYFPAPSKSDLKTEVKSDNTQLLTWKAVPYAEAYQVTYVTDKESGEEIKEIVTDNQLEVENTTGYLQWKVRVVDPETKKWMSSNSKTVDWYKKAKKIASVDTTRKKPIEFLGGNLGQAITAAPIITSPAPRKTYISLDQSPLFIVMNWTYAEKAKAFDVEISKNADMTELVYKKRVHDKNRAVVNQVFEPGIYFLRVRAVRKNVLNEAWSETEVFRVINHNGN